MPRSNFRVGQKVRCIGMDELYQNKLTIGQVYTISRISEPGNIYVEENNGRFFYAPEFFEAAPDAPQKVGRVKWTKEMLTAEALKYKTLTEFRRYGYNAHAAAVRMGIIDDITAHMPKRFFDKKKGSPDGKRLFIRYQNRKLYDTKESKYVTLAEILSLPVGTFKVLDSKTKNDVTEHTLIQGVTAALHDKPEKFEALKAILIETEILKGAPNA